MVKDKEGRTVFSVKAIVCADTSDDGTKTIVCNQEGKVTLFTFLLDDLRLFDDHKNAEKYSL